VILLDLFLPGMSGGDFLEVRERFPRLATVPVVLMSGAENAASVAESRQVALLRKPFGASDLCRVVERDSPRKVG
jgi:CheY-like chemotaxis protein